MSKYYRWAQFLPLIFFIQFSQGQDSLGKATASNPPLVCSFSCNNSFSFLQSRCPSGSMILREVPVESIHVNPYAEFDTVIKQLKKDPENPFPLSYLFKSCNAVCNAASTIDVNNVQVIYYNQDFLDGLRGNDDNVKWAIRAIIAHEIGHHFLGHTLPTNAPIDQPERRKRERRADYFAGFVIRQFSGATLDNALAGINSLDPATYLPKTDDQENGSDYPTLQHRKEAVTDGFVQAVDDSIRLPLLRNIDSIALILFVKYQHSQIFRVIDEQMASKNFDKAKDMIDKFLHDHPDFVNKEILLRQKSMIFELRSDLKKAIQFQNAAVQSAPDNPEQLSRLKDLLQKGNAGDKKKAEEVQEKLKSLQQKNLQLIEP
jgi:tetratricopeptide (TPR) repeat protein